MPETAKKRLLTDFLKARRAALHPADVGLPEDDLTRRRTPGLRRSEVAALAGISTEWYTFFEMGRERAMSVRVIEPVAKALRLNQVERDYLYDLVRADPPSSRENIIHPGIEKIVARLDDSIVLVYDRWLNALMWNVVSEAIFQIEDDDPIHLNVLWRIFHHPRLRRMSVAWEKHARFTVGLFRRALGRDPLNPEAHRILAVVSAAPEFARIWAEHQVDSFEAAAERSDGDPASLFLDESYGRIMTHPYALPLVTPLGGHLRIMVPADAPTGEALQTAARQLIARNGGRSIYRRSA